jgi:hypothetical protein
MGKGKQKIEAKLEAMSSVFAFDRAKASFKILETLQKSSRTKVAQATKSAKRKLRQIDPTPLVLKLRKLGFSTREELNDLRQQIKHLETRLARLEPHSEPSPQSFPQA